jgi:hypothetical protein
MSWERQCPREEHVTDDDDAAFDIIKNTRFHFQLFLFLADLTISTQLQMIQSYLAGAKTKVHLI